jgi:hypothetical protein
VVRRNQHGFGVDDPASPANERGLVAIGHRAIAGLALAVLAPARGLPVGEEHARVREAERERPGVPSPTLSPQHRTVPFTMRAHTLPSLIAIWTAPLVGVTRAAGGDDVDEDEDESGGDREAVEPQPTTRIRRASFIRSKSTRGWRRLIPPSPRRHDRGISQVRRLAHAAEGRSGSSTIPVGRSAGKV